jgi:hypothetical protein
VAGPSACASDDDDIASAVASATYVLVRDGIA